MERQRRVLRTIKMQNEIISMKDVEWCITNSEPMDTHDRDSTVLLPSAKIINIDCNGVIVHNVTSMYCTSNLSGGGLLIAYKEHPHSIERKHICSHKLPGGVPVNVTGNLADFELVVETMSEFFIQIIDPTFHDHNVQTKIDNELAAEALYASYTEEKKRKFDEYKMKCKRRREERLKAEGYKT